MKLFKTVICLVTKGNLSGQVHCERMTSSNFSQLIVTFKNLSLMKEQEMVWFLGGRRRVCSQSPFSDLKNSPLSSSDVWCSDLWCPGSSWNGIQERGIAVFDSSRKRRGRWKEGNQGRDGHDIWDDHKDNFFQWGSLQLSFLFFSFLFYFFFS